MSPASRSTRSGSSRGSKRQLRTPTEYWKVQHSTLQDDSNARPSTSRGKRLKLYTGEGKHGLVTPKKEVTKKKNSKTTKKEQVKKKERVARPASRKLIILEDDDSYESASEIESDNSYDNGSESTSGDLVDRFESIERILDVRELKSDEGGERSKEYLVKHKGESYLHTEWVREDDLLAAIQVHQGLAHRFRKFQLQDDRKEKRGVDPNFVVVERVIADKYNKVTKVGTSLIKWTSLPYSEVTWEEDELCRKEATGFESAREAHQARKPIFELAQEQARSVEVSDTKLKINSSIKDPSEACQFGSLRLAAKRRSSSKKKKNRSRLDIDNSNKAPSSDFKKYEETPDFLKEGGTLYPYQLDGLNWLEFSWQTGKHVILGDEMGLGKTVQAITFVSSLASRGCSMPHIVVGPLSTLLNWEREFQKWAPHLNVINYSGTIVDRQVIYKNELFAPTTSHKGLSLGKRIKFHVLLTTYEMILADRSQLSKISYASLIIDEGHRLKSRSSKLFDALQQFKCEQRVILTGTPLQNNLEELFMLMHFIDPKKFTDDEIENFMSQYADIDKKEQIEELHRLLKPHLLRRMKTDVLKELPPKKEQIVLVEMSHEQKDMYKAMLTSNYGLLSSKSGSKVSGLKNLLMELRKCCLHPCLLTKDYKMLSRKGERLAQFTKLSGKLQLLERMLEKLMKRGHRTLIYSQFTTVLDLIMEWLHLKRIPSLILDGSIKGKDRQKAVDTFNSEQEKYQIFLLSTRAGGLGINLATADTVIIFDSDWNPHNDLQAQARAHRLGQSKEVMIYRLVTRATVEERIVEQAKKKMVLEHLVVRKGGKEDQMKQEEVDDIIRFGVSELFQKEEADQSPKVDLTKEGEDLPPAVGKESLASKEKQAGREGGNKGKGVYYDDEALDKILDRKAAWEEHNKELEANATVEEVKDAEYLQAFKVANFELQEQEQEGNFWEEVLEEAHQSAAGAQAQGEERGRGKRKRKNLDASVINFINSGKDDFFYEEDYKPKANESSSSEDSDSESDSGCTKLQKELKAKKKEKEREAMLVQKAQKESENVANSFSKLDKRNFFNLFMRYGQGEVSEEGHSDFRQIKDHMKNKSEADIQEYGILFLNGLVDTSGDKELSPKELAMYTEMRVKGERLSILRRLADLHFLGSIKSVKPESLEELKEEAVFGKRNWKVADDFHLVQGVLKHGYGQWKLVAADESIGLYDAIAFEALDPEARSKSTMSAMDNRVPIWVKRRVNQITRILCERQATRKNIDMGDLFLSLYDRFNRYAQREQGRERVLGSRSTVAPDESNPSDDLEVITVGTSEEGNNEPGERRVDTSDDGDSQSDVIIVEKDQDEVEEINNQRLRLQEAVVQPAAVLGATHPANAQMNGQMSAASSLFNLNQLSGLNLSLSDFNQLVAAQQFRQQASGLTSMGLFNTAAPTPSLHGLMGQMMYGQAGGSGLHASQNITTHRQPHSMLNHHLSSSVGHQHQQPQQGLDPANTMLQYQKTLEQKLMTMTRDRQSLPLAQPIAPSSSTDATHTAQASLMLQAQQQQQQQQGNNQQQAGTGTTTQNHHHHHTQPQ